MMDDESRDQGIPERDADWEELQRSYEFAIASGKKSRRIALLLYAFALLGGLAAIVWMVTERLEDQQGRLDEQEKQLTGQQKQLGVQQERLNDQRRQFEEQRRAIESAQQAAIEELENKIQKSLEETRKLLAKQEEDHTTQLREHEEERQRLLDQLQTVQADSRQLLQSASREAAELADEIDQLAALRLEQEKLLRAILAEAENAKRELLAGVLQRLTYPIRPKKKTYLPLLQTYVVGDGLKDLQEEGSFLVEDFEILGRDHRRLWPPGPEPMDLASGETVEFQYLGCDVNFRMIYLRDGILRNEVGAEFTWAASNEGAACGLDEPSES